MTGPTHLAPVAIHRYTLHPLASPLQTGPGQNGVLARWGEGPEGWGYGCVHPWPQLGQDEADEPLDAQIEGLRTGRATPLIVNARGCAKCGHATSRQGVSIFSGLRIPESHFTHLGLASELDLALIYEQGFRVVKLKDFRLTDALISEALRLGVKLRLDFNARLAFDEAFELIKSWQGHGFEWLDFIEDPCPFSLEHWQRLKAEFGVRLAADFEGQGAERLEAADFVIYKPARDLANGLDPQRTIVTSYLDHPVGQLFAAWRAAELYKNIAQPPTCGLATHLCYAPNEFSERLVMDGPVLVPPSGPGFGFDDLLEKLAWEPL